MEVQDGKLVMGCALSSASPTVAMAIDRGERLRLRPSGAACAKKGASGRMQCPQELVPVRNGPQCGVKAP